MPFSGKCVISIRMRELPLRDLAAFGRMLTDGGVVAGQRFLSPQAVARLSTVQSSDSVRERRSAGWDIDTPHSRPRGTIFPIGSFGHTGFTGVSLWMDPGSDTYVVVLANVIHQRGGPPITKLAGEVATAAGRALHLG